MKKIIFTLFLLPLCAHAATVRLVASGTAVSGQPFNVGVMLDTQGDDANTVQATIDYPANIVSLQSVNDGGSIIDFWITPPAAASSGEVAFAGIVPGGFTGSSGTLISLVFNPLASGTAAFNVATATVLRNDGLGSSIPVTLSSAAVIVTDSLSDAG